MKRRGKKHYKTYPRHPMDKILRARRPEEWQVKIAAIQPNTLRVQVACIVYWDYFAQRPCMERWPHLDAIMEQWSPHTTCEPRDIRAALEELGYPPHRALKRCNVSNYIPDPLSRGRDREGNR